MRIPLAPHSLTTGEALLLTNPHTDTLALYTITNHDHLNGTFTAQLLCTNHITHAPETINGTLHGGTIKTHPQTLNTTTPTPIDLNPKTGATVSSTETTPPSTPPAPSSSTKTKPTASSRLTTRDMHAPSATPATRLSLTPTPSTPKPSRSSRTQPSKLGWTTLARPAPHATSTRKSPARNTPPNSSTCSQATART